jgi:hypothetical protein
MASAHCPEPICVQPPSATQQAPVHRPVVQVGPPRNVPPAAPHEKTLRISQLPFEKQHAPSEICPNAFPEPLPVVIATSHQENTTTQHPLTVVFFMD